MVKKDVATVVVEPSVVLDEKQIESLLVSVRESKAHITELLLSLMKWLFTSQLAINGAAAVALPGIERLDATSLFWAEIWFVAGVIFSLLSVLFALFYFLKFMPDIGGILTLKPGRHTVEKISMLTSGEDAAEPWKDPVIYVGALPALCFVVGIAIVVTGLR
jgi:hypothetical protein